MSLGLHRLFLCASILATMLVSVASLELTYCSLQNTGELVNSSLYMSNGLCHDKCSGYALAIVQQEECYCGDYLPATTLSLTQCDLDCPGYPSEKCGSSDGKYGYILLGDASGTWSVASSTSTSTSISKTSATSSLSSTARSSKNTSSFVLTSTSSVAIASTTSATLSSVVPSSSSSFTPSLTTSSTTNSSTSTTTISSTSSSANSSAPPSTTPFTSTTTNSSISTAASITYSPISYSSSKFFSTLLPTTDSSSATSQISSVTPSSFAASSLTLSSSLEASYSSSSSAVPIVTSVIYKVSTVSNVEQTQYVTTAVQTTITLARSTSSGSPLPTQVSSNVKESNTDSFFNSKGKVAGVFTVVGVLAFLIVVLSALLIWRWCVKRHGKPDYDYDREVMPPSGAISDSNPFSNKHRIRIDDEEVDISSTDDTYTEKIGTRHGHTQSSDFGTPIIGNNGDSTYIDQRLDVGTFEHINENGDVLSLNDNKDYSRRVLKVSNP